ncbi:hypothetical protein [Rhizomonospora bruguierae]|uniref:hypothetical protein n=1 Tax=Rhizomonospora bruguierae TaxID=1581705 RepID=UPI001BCDF5A8|nr:hypothetical protein [Micromonospora sp. NBRC 107566]
MFKKFYPLLFAVLLIFFIIRSPDGAAAAARGLGTVLTAAVDGIGDFLSVLGGGR